MHEYIRPALEFLGFLGVVAGVYYAIRKPLTADIKDAIETHRNKGK